MEIDNVENRKLSIKKGRKMLLNKKVLSEIDKTSAEFLIQEEKREDE